MTPQELYDRPWVGHPMAPHDQTNEICAPWLVNGHILVAVEFCGTVYVIAKKDDIITNVWRVV